MAKENKVNDFKVIFRPGAPTPERAKAEKIKELSLLISGIVLLAMGILILLIAPEMDTFGYLANSVGSLFIIMSYFIPLWAKWVRLNTFIGIDCQDYLSMWSPFKVFPSRFRVPFSHVSSIARLTGKGKTTGWYFQGKNLKSNVRFNPSLFPAQKHKSMLGELIKYGGNIKITSRQLRKPATSGKTADEDWIHLTDTD